MSPAMADLTSKMSSLSPFSHRRKEDKDDVGLTNEGAGGGKGIRPHNTEQELHVSQPIRQFLASQGLADAPDGLSALLNRQYIQVPRELLDPSFPLADYFISSSHNTYLLAHQLYGKSCASGYESTLHAGARCVEIDAWDSDDPLEPKVTHGFTLVSNIKFRDVCVTVRDSIDAETRDRPGSFVPPILLSLENHCKPEGQKRLVEIMKEVFGDRLAVVGAEADHVPLNTLGGKVCCIVEHYIPNAGAPASEAGSSDSEDDVGEVNHAVEESEDDKSARKEYEKKRENEVVPPIIPELAAIGIANSCKPTNTSWFEDKLLNGPLRHMINVSESALGKFLPAEGLKIAQHNAQHLMRCYPHGLRINSANLRPVPFWGIGAQVCALNWQTYGASMQINEALFVGTDGYVLKPASLRLGGIGSLQSTKKRLRLRVVGASDIPAREKLHPYITCTLVHPNDLSGKPPKRKTSGYKSESTFKWLGDHDKPPTTDPVWDETLEWEYEDNDLTFLRVLIKSDDKFAANPTLAVTALRLLYVQPGWCFLRFLDLNGQNMNTTLLVHIQIEDA